MVETWRRLGWMTMETEKERRKRAETGRNSGRSEFGIKGIQFRKEKR